MCLHPEIQEKASNEILVVTGGDRLPTLADKPRLPYIEALICELHRFRPVVNLVPRSALKSDDFEGYHIPSKIWLLCNIWFVVLLL
jgi:cytochrome P450